MEKINKIMVALDFSEYSEEAFDFAANLASEVGAELVVVNVINQRDVEAVSQIESMGYEVSVKDYVKGIEEERMQQMEEIVKGSPLPKDKIKVIFKVGHPVEKLLEAIKEEKVDLVVTGTKGRTNIENLLFGPVAEKIFRRSPVTVVSYRGEKHMSHLKRLYKEWLA